MRLPAKTHSCHLQFFTPLSVAKSFTLLTGAGAYRGHITFGSQAFGDSLVVADGDGDSDAAAKLIPYSLFGNGGKSWPVSLVQTPFHLLTLMSGGEIVITSKVDNKQVGVIRKLNKIKRKRNNNSKRSSGRRSTNGGSKEEETYKMVDLLRDRSSGRLWVCRRNSQLKQRGDSYLF